MYCQSQRRLYPFLKVAHKVDVGGLKKSSRALLDSLTFISKSIVRNKNIKNLHQPTKPNWLEVTSLTVSFQIIRSLNRSGDQKHATLLKYFRLKEQFLVNPLVSEPGSQRIPWNHSHYLLASYWPGLGGGGVEPARFRQAFEQCYNNIFAIDTLPACQSNKVYLSKSSIDVFLPLGNIVTFQLQPTV